MPTLDPTSNVQESSTVLTTPMISKAAYGILRNETKRNKLIHKEMTVHQVNDTTKIYSLSSKPVLARCLVSQNTNNSRLLINETRFADNFFRRSAYESYLTR